MRCVATMQLSPTRRHCPRLHCPRLHCPLVVHHPTAAPRDAFTGDTQRSDTQRSETRRTDSAAGHLAPPIRPSFSRVARRLLVIPTSLLCSMPRQRAQSLQGHLRIQLHVHVPLLSPAAVRLSTGPAVEMRVPVCVRQQPHATSLWSAICIRHVQVELLSSQQCQYGLFSAIGDR